METKPIGTLWQELGFASHLEALTEQRFMDKKTEIEHINRLVARCMPYILREQEGPIEGFRRVTTAIALWCDENTSIDPTQLVTVGAKLERGTSVEIDEATAAYATLVRLANILLWRFNETPMTVEQRLMYLRDVEGRSFKAISKTMAEEFNEILSDDAWRKRYTKLTKVQR